MTRCWDISGGGEMVCPDPSAPSWVTTPVSELARTGADLAIYAAFGLAALALGLLVLYLGRKVRR